MLSFYCIWNIFLLLQITFAAQSPINGWLLGLVLYYYTPKTFMSHDERKRNSTGIKFSIWIQFDKLIFIRFPRWTPAIRASSGILNYLKVIRSLKKTVQQLLLRRKKINSMSPGCKRTERWGRGKETLSCGLVSLAVGWRVRTAGGGTFVWKHGRYWRRKFQSLACKNIVIFWLWFDITAIYKYHNTSIPRYFQKPFLYKFNFIWICIF